MSSRSVFVAAALVLTAALAVGASAPQAPAPADQSQQPAAQPPAPQQGAPPAAAGRGRGGGRGGPGAALYTEHCVSCHGTDLAGGRYDTLFDQAWLAKITDERMVSSIQNGVPNTEMEGFKQALTELQIWQLVQYIRTQGGSLAPKPQFVTDPNGHVIKTESLSLRAEVVARDLADTMGARVPARWPSPYYRACRPAPHPRQGEAVGTGQRHTCRARTAGRRHVRRRDPSAVRKERLDLSRVLGSTSGFRSSASGRARRRRRQAPHQVVAADRRYPR